MKRHKKNIHKSLRENVWIYWIGEKFTAKCMVEWCNKKITPFTFETGHNIPESKGGQTVISNLRPICPSCNKSMGNKYTIEEYSTLYKPEQQNENFCVVNKKRVFGCFCISPAANIV